MTRRARSGTRFGPRPTLVYHGLPGATKVEQSIHDKLIYAIEEFLRWTALRQDNALAFRIQPSTGQCPIVMIEQPRRGVVYRSADEKWRDLNWALADLRHRLEDIQAISQLPAITVLNRPRSRGAGNGKLLGEIRFPKLNIDQLKLLTDVIRTYRMPPAGSTRPVSTVHNMHKSECLRLKAVRVG